MSAHLRSKPKFGKPRMQPEYYTTINGIISVLRDTATLKVIANHLNSAGTTTPTGLQWSKPRLANYLNKNDLTSN
jgi:hypothetical protein